MPDSSAAGKLVTAFGFSRTLSQRGALLTALTIGCFTAVGCGYMIGDSFPQQVESVHVPTFRSETNRRGIEYQLTEAVQREIKQRSSMRLAKPPFAQTRLTGRIVEMSKSVVGETQFDDARELQLRLAVEVKWEDLRTGQILAQQRIALPADLRQAEATAEFAPELGHSLATGSSDVVSELATRIVDMMELAW